MVYVVKTIEMFCVLRCICNIVFTKVRILVNDFVKTIFC